MLDRPLRAMLGLIFLALLLAGCAGDDAEGEEADSDPAAEEGDDGEDAGDSEGDTAEDEGEAEDEGDDADLAGTEITVYSGRSEELVGPLFERFTEETGIEASVRYGDTAEMAATILEEGDNSPADVFFGQDAGALGALREEGRFVELPDDLLDRVEARFRSPDGTWVGTSGRARTIAYNTDAVSSDELPESVLDLTEPEWEGRVGWAPTNGSFQAFVTAMRVELGDDATREWVEGMIANDVTDYENNTAQVEAAGRGEIDLGLVNHYYLYRFLEEDPDYPVENLFLESGDPGALVNVAGAGVIDSSEEQEASLALIEYLLSEDAQQYVADEVFEFPLVAGVEGDERLPSIEELETPDIDLSDLSDLQGTLELLREAGALP